MTIEEIEEIIGSIKDIDTCALLLLERKMYDDWMDVAKIYSQEGRELQFAYYEYWTNLIRQDYLGTDFKYFILNESYCDHYWSSEVRHGVTDELCGELLFVNGTNLVEAVYLRALILNKKLEHIYRVEGCSREYTSGLFYLINLRQSLYVDNAYGSHPLMSLKGKELFYNASIRVGECKGFTKEVFEIFNLGGDVKHLFIKEKEE